METVEPGMLIVNEDLTSQQCSYNLYEVVAVHLGNVGQVNLVTLVPMDQRPQGERPIAVPYEFLVNGVDKASLKVFKEVQVK